MSLRHEHNFQFERKYGKKCSRQSYTSAISFLSEANYNCTGGSRIFQLGGGLP